MRISVLILKHMAFSSPDCSKKSEQSISFWNSKYSFEEETSNLPIELPLRAVIWGTKFSYFEKNIKCYYLFHNSEFCIHWGAHGILA